MQICKVVDTCCLIRFLIYELVQGKKKGLCLHVEDIDSFSTSILHEMLIWKTLP